MYASRNINWNKIKSRQPQTTVGFVYCNVSTLCGADNFMKGCHVLTSWTVKWPSHMYFRMVHGISKRYLCWACIIKQWIRKRSECISFLFSDATLWCCFYLCRNGNRKNVCTFRWCKSWNLVIKSGGARNTTWHNVCCCFYFNENYCVCVRCVVVEVWYLKHITDNMVTNRSGGKIDGSNEISY